MTFIILNNFLELVLKFFCFRSLKKKRGLQKCGYNTTLPIDSLFNPNKYGSLSRNSLWEPTVYYKYGKTYNPEDLGLFKKKL